MPPSCQVGSRTWIEVVGTKPEMDASALNQRSATELTNDELKYILTSGAYEKEVLDVAIAEAAARDDEELFTKLKSVFPYQTLDTKVQLMKAYSASVGKPYFAPSDATNYFANVLNESEDPILRGWSAVAIARIGSDDAVMVLQKRLSEENSEAVIQVINKQLESLNGGTF